MPEASNMACAAAVGLGLQHRPAPALLVWFEHAGSLQDMRITVLIVRNALKQLAQGQAVPSMFHCSTEVEARSVDDGRAG